MPFAQVVLGPPGAGKTTYCNGMQQFLELLGRKVAVVNLDPANDDLPYRCALNVEDLVRLEDVMTQHNLGPNGGLVFCMEYLEKNLDWLLERLAGLEKDHDYFLFDLPGQVELFTLHDSTRNILGRLEKERDYRFVAVQLMDSHLCCEPHKFVSALLQCLGAMLHLGLPHVNVLSKIDMIQGRGGEEEGRLAQELAFDLSFYTEVQDLEYLQRHLDADPRSAKFGKLTSALCELVDDYSLVSFKTLCIEDKESVAHLVGVIDKANGYVFRGIQGSPVEFSKVAMKS